MDVFLVPTGKARYAPYCEHADDGHDPADERGRSRGWLGGLQARFRSTLAAIERERLRSAEERARLRRTWWGRLKERLMRWVAEAVAQQRLLWHLRGRGDARLFYRSELGRTEAVRLRKRFVAEHLLQWMGELGDRAAESSGSGFYRAAIDAAHALLRAESGAVPP